MNKRAEMTSNAVIGYILLAIAAIILVYFLVQGMGWTGTIDKETCHQSVVERGTVPAILENYVPLKCKTEKICITNGNGKCREFEGIKGITYAKVSNKEQVERAIADNIIDCWTMMGEGKLSLYSKTIKSNILPGGVTSQCIVCSRIAFDKEGLLKAKINSSEINVLNFMQTHIYPGKEISYYDYLTGEQGKISIGGEDKDLIIPKFENVNESFVASGKENESFKPISHEELIKAIEQEKKNYELQNAELSIIFMQITGPKHSDILGYLKNVAIGSAVTPGGGLIARMVAKGCTLQPPVCLVTLAVGAYYQQGSVAYNRAITQSKCGDVSVGSEARDGCSVIRTVNYNEESIRQYCDLIESIP